MGNYNSNPPVPVRSSSDSSDNSSHSDSLYDFEDERYKQCINCQQFTDFCTCVECVQCSKICYDVNVCIHDKCSECCIHCPNCGEIDCECRQCTNCQHMVIDWQDINGRIVCEECIQHIETAENAIPQPDIWG